MGRWIQDLPIALMALVILTITYLVAGVILAIVTRLARGGRVRILRGVSSSILSPLGTIFGLFVAFIAVQVWNDADRASSAVNREAGALRTSVLLAASFPGEPESRIRELIARHIDEAVSQEWPMMAQQTQSLRVAPRALGEALQVVLAWVPKAEGQVIAQREITSAIESAIDARRQRIIVSRSSVTWVKWACMFLQAICLFIVIAVVHSENRGAGAVALGIFATGVAVSVLLIASHDRPFSGRISVQPDLLLQVMPESRK
jgi:hypothetical protein